MSRNLGSGTSEAYQPGLVEQTRNLLAGPDVIGYARGHRRGPRIRVREAGVITFMGAGGKMERVIVSVKSGNVNSGMVQVLKGAMERHKAAIGLFVTLEEPSGPMRKEATLGGFYHSELANRDYPRVQILSVRDAPGLPGVLPRQCASWLWPEAGSREPMICSTCTKGRVTRSASKISNQVVSGSYFVIAAPPVRARHQFGNWHRQFIEASLARPGE